MKRILVAFDGGEPARRALHTAIDLAKRFDGIVDVVSVVPYVPAGGTYFPWDDHAEHARELEDARSILRERGFDPELIQPIGDPARSIERIAEDGGYDTVVVGSRGLGALSRLFQGSVSSHVASNAHTTVVVAR